MAAPRPNRRPDDAQTRYRNGRLAANLGGGVIAAGYTLSLHDDTWSSVGAGVVIFLGMFLMALGCEAKGEASVFLDAWAKDRDAE